MPPEGRLSSRTASVSPPLCRKTLLLPHLGHRFFRAVSLILILATLSSVRQPLVMLPMRHNPEGIVHPLPWIMRLPPHSRRLRREMDVGRELVYEVQATELSRCALLRFLSKCEG